MMGSNEKNKNSISIEQKHVQTIINFLKAATPPVNEGFTGFYLYGLSDYKNNVRFKNAKIIRSKASSNSGGSMLQEYCLPEGIDLVNALNIALEQQGHHERVDEKSKSVYVSL